jgi:hypothetical protein
MRTLAWVVVCGLFACNGSNSDESTFTMTVPETTGGGTSTDGATTAPPTTSMPDDSTTTTSGTSTSEPTTTTTTPSTSSSEPTTEDPPTTGDETSTGETTMGEESTTGEVCLAPGLLNVCDDGDDVDPFHALGLGCPGAEENTLPIENSKFTSQMVAYTVARGFGTAEDPAAPGELLFRPREGEKLLIISTGQVGELNDDGVLVVAESQFDNDNNFNNDMPNALPSPMSPLVGSANGAGGTPFEMCDGVNDCSDSIDPNWTLGNGDPNDILFASFDITVPGGTYGFEFDVAYFSSEFPAFVGEQFNDMFIGWSTSEAYTGNVTFYLEQPFTVTSLAEAMMLGGYTYDAPELAGTGFEGHGSTGWATVSAQAVPGETFTFALAIMDMGDSSKATAAVLDHWRWSCKGCVPQDVDPECGMPDHPKCCGLCVAPQDDPACGEPGHPMCCVPG